MKESRMDHEATRGMLPDLMCGGLDPTETADLEEHLAECPSCRGWVDTYRLLEEAVGGGAGAGDPHSGPEVLALCAVRPEEEFELERGDLREHLAQCQGCRQDLEALKHAIREARPAIEASAPRRSRQRRRVAAMAWGGLAATLATVGIGLTLFLGGTPRDRAPQAGGPGPAVAASSAASQAEPGETLSNVELEGQRLIVADHSLLVTDVKVKPGGRVIFQVGEVAAFGDGFQIGDGGSVVVEVGRRGRENGSNKDRTSTQ